MKKTKLMLGDNLESLKKLPDNSIDSIVSDPPYGLSFMGKKWDYDVPSVEFWKEVYRVLKPGGHILSFGGTRTYHRMVVNIEDAGFEIRDQIQWLYASGFPKSHNIGKAIAKINGEDVKIGKAFVVSGNLDNNIQKNLLNGKEKEGDWRHIPTTEEAIKYEGWGTALKPANEPICVARKPLSEKSVAENVLKWGTGGINIDGCRIGTEKHIVRGTNISGMIGENQFNRVGDERNYDGMNKEVEGRFPANIILDETAAELLDLQSGVSKSTGAIRKKDTETDATSIDYKHRTGELSNPYAGQVRGASRFFYVAKVSKKERNMGLGGFEEKKIHGINQLDDRLRPDGTLRKTPVHKNSHPTVKPINLMIYLCRLITPQGGIVLDPFMGSGSTGIAALLEGFRFVGMEMDKDYFKIAEARIDNYEKYRNLVK